MQLAVQTDGPEHQGCVGAKFTVSIGALDWREKGFQAQDWAYPAGDAWAPSVGCTNWSYEHLL